MASHLVWALAVLAAISCPAAANFGQQITIGEQASIAQIEVRVGTVWIQQCVAIVLTSVHGLCPARCMSGTLFLLENRRMRAGSSRRGYGGSLVQINFATNHPNYGLRGSDSDISILRLASSLSLGATIQQARIPAQGTGLPFGLPVQAYGWGSTIQGGPTSNADLHRVGLLIQPTDRCAAAYPADSPVTENMICVGLPSGGRDYDARDAGAPVVYDNIVMALMSFGTTSGNNVPVVGTAISSYTNWIVANAV